MKQISEKSLLPEFLIRCVSFSYYSSFWRVHASTVRSSAFHLYRIESLYTPRGSLLHRIDKQPARVLAATDVHVVRLRKSKLMTQVPTLGLPATLSIHNPQPPTVIGGTVLTRLGRVP